MAELAEGGESLLFETARSAPGEFYSMRCDGHRHEDLGYSQLLFVVDEVAPITYFPDNPLSQ